MVQNGILQIKVGDQVLIMSDTHFGLLEDNFNREQIITDWLYTQLKKFEYIVLNGDIFETWKYDRIKLTVKQRTYKIDKILSKVRGLKELLDNPRVILIKGNHDYALKYHSMISYEKLLIKSHKTCHIEHGNNASDTYSFKKMDSFISKVSVVFDFLTDITFDFFTKIGIINNKIELEEELTELYFAAKDDIDQLYIDYAETLIADFKVFGHTHKQGNWKLKDDSYYFNSGGNLVHLEYSVFDGLSVHNEQKDFPVN